MNKTRNIERMVWLGGCTIRGLISELEDFALRFGEQNHVTVHSCGTIRLSFNPEEDNPVLKIVGD